MALGEVPASMDVLRDANIWICDSGASNHSTNSDAGARNKRDTTSASLGHVGQTVKVKATSFIDRGESCQVGLNLIWRNHYFFVKTML